MEGHRNLTRIIITHLPQHADDGWDPCGEKRGRDVADGSPFRNGRVALAGPQKDETRGRKTGSRDFRRGDGGCASDADTGRKRTPAVGEAVCRDVCDGVPSDKRNDVGGIGGASAHFGRRVEVCQCPHLTRHFRQIRQSIEASVDGQDSDVERILVILAAPLDVVPCADIGADGEPFNAIVSVRSH